ncbi:ZPR1 zinc finger domain-containing protein [Besnoitia besnoiti]|uniref:ZPR1 zinc finger domain-containing protein n=1 Tax=Besnoitia besnoiti TaxID=94643 RepID=A0A2A9MI63_BESBE|nr:ZPR1 zinc finger domain-containing protein [Besnoitia besnoiti]PFH37589.1 ZPR1 zinc finger domain-containing protein [Besnoitia besnoiti]
MALEEKKPEGEEARAKREEEEDELLRNLTEVESMCPSCEENGKTLLLLHKIPHFKEIILVSFSCPHCNYSNREVQSAAALAPQGVRLELTVRRPADFDRQLVKGEHATVILKELEIEIPPKRERGELTTVEGLTRHMIETLRLDQPARRVQCPQVAEQIDQVILKLVRCIASDALETPWTLILDDPSGNSYIEALPAAAEAAAEVPAGTSPEDFAPLDGGKARDFQVRITRYERSKEQLHAMGFYEAQNDEKRAGEEEREGADIPAQLREGAKPHVWDLSQPLPEDVKATAARDEKDKVLEEDYVFSLPVACPHCGTEGSNNVCEIDVPGFRRCLIFSFLCQNCGGRHSEIKAAGAFGPTGRRWILIVENAEDLNRDVLKSDTAVVEIPSLDFSMQGGVQGGEFTTVEGLLGKLAEALGESAPFACGDSAPTEKREKMSEVIEKIRALEKGENLPFTFIVDDCADMSFIGRRRSALLEEKNRHRKAKEADQPAEKAEGKREDAESSATHYKDGEAREELAEIVDEKLSEEDIKKAKEGDVLLAVQVDAQLTTERYKRTKEQEDDLGLTDMQV